jgi:hypothetical protein
MKNKLILTTLICFLTSSSIFSKEVPSAGEMIMDFPARVVGLAATGIGLGIFAITLPFSGINALITGSAEGIKNTGKRMVLAPAYFTFVRGVGEYPGYMEELELVKE